MKKKFLLILSLLSLFVAVFALGGCSKIGENVLDNGDFSTIGENTQAENWTLTDSDDVKDSEGDSTTTEFTWKSDNDPQSDQYIPEIGSRYLYVSLGGTGYGYAYAGQKVKLDAGSVYKLSAYIKVDSDIKGKYSDSVYVGARVGFLEDKDFDALDVKKANKEWTYYEAYITPATSRSLTLVAGIGDEKMGLAKGSASFGAINVEKVKKSAVPAGATIHSVKYGSDYNLSDGASITYTVLGVIIALALCYGVYILVRKQFAGNDLLPAKFDKKVGNKFLSPMALFIYVLTGAFAVRLVLALVLKGQGVAIDALSNAAIKLVDYGPVKYFEHDVSSMPFGTLYILWALGGFAQLTNIQFGSLGMSILMRLPMIVADIVSCYLVFSFAMRFYNEKVAAGYAGLWALMPCVFTASGAWGMTMSVSVCFIIAAIIAAVDKKFVSATVLYTLAAVTDNMSALLLPLMVGYLIYYFVTEKQSRIKIGVSFLSCFVAMILLSLPFTFDYMAKGKVFFVFEKYYQAYAGNAYLNEDIFNIYSLFGLANKPSNTALNVLNVIFVLILSAGAVYLFVKTKNRINLPLLAAGVGLTYAVIGVKATLPVMLLGLGLLLVYVILSAERRAYHIMTGFGTLFFLNTAQLMGQSGYLSNNPNADQIISFNAVSAFMIIFSLAALALALYTLWVVYDVCVNNREKEILPLQGSLRAELGRYASMIRIGKRK